MSPIAAAYESHAADSAAPPVAVEDAVQDDSSRLMHCATALDEQRIREALHEADAVLDAVDWAWMRELIDAMHDREIAERTKLFFLQLLHGADVDQVNAVLEDMETWREELMRDKNPRLKRKSSLEKEERDGIQALFLLGIDKQMSLAHSP